MKNLRQELIELLNFRDKIFWGENEYTENDEIVDLWLKKKEINPNEPEGKACNYELGCQFKYTECTNCGYFY